MVEHQLPKLKTRVRFPSSAPRAKPQVTARLLWSRGSVPHRLSPRFYSVRWATYRVTTLSVGRSVLLACKANWGGLSWNQCVLVGFGRSGSTPPTPRFPASAASPAVRCGSSGDRAATTPPARDGVIRTSTSADNGRTWTAATTAVSDAPGVDLRDPCAATAGGTTWLTYFKGTAANAAAGCFPPDLRRRRRHLGRRDPRRPQPVLRRHQRARRPGRRQPPHRLLRQGPRPHPRLLLARHLYRQRRHLDPPTRRRRTRRRSRLPGTLARHPRHERLDVPPLRHRQRHRSLRLCRQRRGPGPRRPSCSTTPPDAPPPCGSPPTPWPS